MQTKTMARIGQKWNNRTSTAGPQYEEGVKNPKRDWGAATKAAEPNYEQGIQASISAKRFGKGVTRAGTAKQQNACIVKGVPHFAAGVALAQPDYEKAFEPYRAALESKTLSPRRAKRDPSNLLRVTEVVNTMIATSNALGGR